MGLAAFFAVLPVKLRPSNESHALWWAIALVAGLAAALSLLFGVVPFPGQQARREAAELQRKAAWEAKLDALDADLYKEVLGFRQPNEPRTYTMLRGFCRDRVLIYLKSPGSAKFVSMHVIAKAGPPTEIIGHVDSQNGYGALLRSTFSCPVTTTNGLNGIGDVFIGSTN